MSSLITFNTYKFDKGGLLTNMSDVFNARVGDQNTPLVIQWRQGTTDTEIDLFKNKLHFFAAGQVGNYLEQTDTGYTMSDDASFIEYEDTAGEFSLAHGITSVKLPAQFFPQSGIFYGYFGLKDDRGTQYTAVNVWFRVLGGIPLMGAAIPYFSTRFDELMETFQGRVEDALAQLRTEYQAEVQKNEDMSAETRAALSKLADAVGAIQAQIDAGNVVTLEKHHEDLTELQEGQKELSVAIDNRLAKITYQPEELLNENAIKQKYPQGNDGKGAVIAADTGHKWLYVSGAWKDCGVYQAAGPDPELVDLRTDYRGDEYKTAGEAIKSDFSDFAKASVTNSAAHRVMFNLPTSGFTNVPVNGDHLFTGTPLFDDSVPKEGSHFTGKYNGTSYWRSLTVSVKAYDILQATFTGPGRTSVASIYYLDKDNNVLRLDSFSNHEGTPIADQDSLYKFTNYPIYCDYNVAEIIICSIDSAPTASIRVPGTSVDVPTKGHWINGSDLGNGSLNTTNMGFRVTTDLPICYDTEVTIFATNNVVFFIGYYDDPSGNSKATETFGERTWARIPAGQYFRLTLCHSDGSQTPLDVAEAVNSIHFRVPSRFDLANQREMLAQAELADRQENIYALVAQDAYDAGKHYHMEKIVDQDKEAKENLDGFQSVYLGKDALHMFGYHNGKPVDRTWNSAGELIAETEKPDTGHDGDVTKIGDDFYIIGSAIKDNTVVNNVIYKWDSKANAKEVIDISSKIGTATDTSHVRFVVGIDRVEGSDSQLIIVTTDGLPDLGKWSIRSASDKLIFWKYDIPSDTLSEINEMRWTETFVQGVTCLDGITYIATNPITRHASDYAGVKIIGYDSGSFRKVKEIYIKGSFEAEGLSNVVDNGVPKLVFGLCHYKDLMRVYKLTL